MHPKAWTKCEIKLAINFWKTLLYKCFFTRKFHWIRHCVTQRFKPISFYYLRERLPTSSGVPSSASEFQGILKKFLKWWPSFKSLHLMFSGNILFYHILFVDISVIKPWLKMIPVKWNDIISLHGLNCPIKQTVIIWLDQSGCTLYFSWSLESNLAGRIVLQFYQRNGRFKMFFNLVAWFF